jgi:hypothetical protein
VNFEEVCGEDEKPVDPASGEEVFQSVESTIISQIINYGSNAMDSTFQT